MSKETYQLTKRRSIHGSFVVYQSMKKMAKTTIDPVGHLMGKRNTGVFTVSPNDYGTLSTHQDLVTNRYVEDDSTEVADGAHKAIAYIESVSQLPEMDAVNDDVKKANPMGAYTNKTHWNEETVRSRFDNIQWFDNAWEGYSWGDEDVTPPCFWTKNYTDLDANDDHTLDWKDYEETHQDRGWRVGFDIFSTYDMVLSALMDFLNMHIHEVHVWIQGSLQDMSSTELIARLKNDASEEFENYMNGRKNAQALWEADLSTSTDVYHYYASRPPQRIPTVPWRVCNMGMRQFPDQKPQVYPATTWMGEVAAKMAAAKMPETVMHTILEDKVIYTNYSGFVKMIPMWKHDKLDFAWKEVRPNEYMIVKNGSAPGPNGYLYKVANPDFFMGMGSVATSQHAAFGVGRSERELYDQMVRKVETGKGTSGHMIASALCHRSHLLWYLEEVYTNLKLKKSIYLMPFNEPEGAEYHTVKEYQHALTDMKEIIRRKEYPKYAVVHLIYCYNLVKHFS
uniref:VP7 n=1 Tax=viral metagenome TaxID=1070528 RepID=A0A2V0RCK3_9ZZZZ